MQMLDWTAEERLQMLGHEGFDREVTEQQLAELDAMGNNESIISTHWGIEPTAADVILHANAVIDEIKSRWIGADEEVPF